MTTTDNNALAERLLAQAKEIAAAGHNGWGNTMAEAAAPLREPSTPSAQLWCLHIEGPDDIHPAPSKAHAEKAAEWFNKRYAGEQDVMMRAVVEPYPYSAESHAEGVDSFITDWLVPQGLATPSAQVSGGGEVAAEFTRWYESSGADNWGTRDAATAAFYAGQQAALSTPQARPDGGAVVAWRIFWDDPRSWLKEDWTEWTTDRGLLREARNRGFKIEYAHPTPAPDVARLVVDQLRQELATDKGWDYTAYEKGRIAEKERCIALLTAAQQEATNGQE